MNPATNTMTHNIDFHASTGALGGGELTLVNPGRAGRPEILKPVFIYHCAPGGPMIPWHVVSGMSSAIMVLPRVGLADEEGRPLTTIASTTSARVTSIFRAIEMEFSNLTAHCWNHIQTPSKSCGG